MPLVFLVPIPCAYKKYHERLIQLPFYCFSSKVICGTVCENGQNKHFDKKEKQPDCQNEQNRHFDNKKNPHQPELMGCTNSFQNLSKTYFFICKKRTVGWAVYPASQVPLTRCGRNLFYPQQFSQ